jgi:uncharacterized membrane protein
MKQAASSTPLTGRNASLGSLFLIAKEYFAEGAKAWGISQRLLGALLAIPFAVAISGVLAALAGKNVYKWLTMEDGFAEDMQVLFYFLAFVLCVLVTRRIWQSDDKVVKVLYLGLCLGLFFLIGEELNWGQRIFGWQTSTSLAAINKQDETNLHNIYGVGATFKWIQLLVGTYGTILPLVVLRWKIPERFQNLVSMVVPPYTLIPYFMFIFIWRIYRNLFEEPKAFYFAIAEYNEVMELILAMGLFLFMVYQFRKLNREQNAPPVTMG